MVLVLVPSYIRAMVGAADGEALGLADGAMVGAADGEALGLADGEALGSAEFVGAVFVGAIVLVPHVAQSYPDDDAEQLAAVLTVRVNTPLTVIIGPSQPGGASESSKAFRRVMNMLLGEKQNVESPAILTVPESFVEPALASPDRAPRLPW